jgi:hypothetical protein
MMKIYAIIFQVKTFFQRILYTPVLIVVYEPSNIPKIETIVESAKKFGYKVISFIQNSLELN